MPLPNLSGSDIKEIIHFIGYVVLWIWAMKFMMCIMQEIFPKHCRHCGRKASGKL